MLERRRPTDRIYDDESYLRLEALHRGSYAPVQSVLIIKTLIKGTVNVIYMGIFTWGPLQWDLYLGSLHRDLYMGTFTWGPLHGDLYMRTFTWGPLHGDIYMGTFKWGPLHGDL